jgi:hypothetical protein
MPEPVLEVTEHRAQIKTCCCGHANRGAFPEGVSAPTQYGPHIKSAAVYLNVYQMLPMNRTAELLSDLVRCAMSEGTLHNAVAAAREAASEALQAIRNALADAAVAGFDETGCRVNAQNEWVHSASTGQLTYYDVDPKRGSEAMDRIGILPAFDGVAVHDAWTSYWQYNCSHGLCNAHLLRELAFLWDQHEQCWAGDMAELLLDTKKQVDRARDGESAALPPRVLTELDDRYDEIIAEGRGENPNRQQRIQKKSHALMNRLEKRKAQVLAFARDFRVPFDNNLSERDIRMIKVKLKISGQFRTRQGAKAFCQLRSYISSAMKNGIAPFRATLGLVSGEPFVPQALPP